MSTTTLVHHFGTKESLLDAILARLRERIVQATSELAGDTPNLQVAARAVWEWTSHPDQWPMFRLFFAVYGSALQAPEAYADFLSQVGTDWTATLVKSQGTKIDPQTAARQATLVIATIRGLLLDLLSSGDRDRVDNAAEHFLSSLG